VDNNAIPTHQLLFDVPTAADILAISKTTVWKLIRTGQLRSVRLDRRVLVSRGALEDFVRGLEAAS
jgi:excisionase family DNA binding protein